MLVTILLKMIILHSFENLEDISEIHHNYSTSPSEIQCTMRDGQSLDFFECVNRGYFFIEKVRLILIPLKLVLKFDRQNYMFVSDNKVLCFFFIFTMN